MKTEVEIKAISTKNKSVLVDMNGKEQWLKVDNKVAPYLKKIKKGKAEMEIGDFGEPITFLKNTKTETEKETKETDWEFLRKNKSASVILSYAKDLVIAEINSLIPLCKDVTEASALIKGLESEIENKAIKLLNIQNKLTEQEILAEIEKV